MAKEARILRKISKKILKKEHRKKINKIKDKKDKFDSLHYMVISQLKLMFDELDFIVLQKGCKDNLKIKSRMLAIPPKIKYFSQKPNNKDFKKILSLFKEVEEEVKNV